MRQSSKQKVLAAARSKKSLITADVVALLGISRQTAAAHLRDLVLEGKLEKEGSTRNARYLLPKGRKNTDGQSRFHAIRTIRGLQEDRVVAEINLRLNLKKRLGKRTAQIVEYAFSEMLNNAIEHSQSSQVNITAEFDVADFRFTIRDTGLGVFRTIRQKFRLADSFAAIEHLLKGKQTTAPTGHSGEGIFFTSKIADDFSLQSEKLKFLIHNRQSDQVVVDQPRFLQGTEVYFSIRRRSRKDLAALFAEFTNDKFEFDRTRVTVRLSRSQSEHVSRSEARRILVGLDQFKRIDLDFKGVSGIGQGFADEIFRVFASAHLHIQIRSLNSSPAVEFMIKRAITTEKG